jgi:sulfite reductase (ferredoxin)
MPDLLGQIQASLEAACLPREPVIIRVTGCPNGCARPYTAEIGIVGQSVGMYALYLGASHLGTRLGFVFAENVRTHEIGPTLLPIFERFHRERFSGERFGDFCHRIGRDGLRAVREIPGVEVAG